MTGFISYLRKYLRTSNSNSKSNGNSSDWKIVFGHHPMYTAGAGHGHTARRLRFEGKQHADAVEAEAEALEKGRQTSTGAGLQDS